MRCVDSLSHVFHADDSMQSVIQSSRSMRMTGMLFLFAGEGVTDIAADGTLVSPPSLVAVSEQRYATPPVNPPTTSGDPKADAVRVVSPFAVQVPV